MKILMTALINPDKNEGSKIHFLEIVNSFIKLGHDVTILVPKYQTKINIPKVNIIQLPFSINYSYINIILLNIIQIIYLKFLLFNKYDLLYSRWRLLPTTKLKWFIKVFRLRTKTYTEQSGWAPLEIDLENGSKLKSKIAERLQRCDAISADKIIVVTKGIKEKLLEGKIVEENIKVIENGTNINKFFPYSIKDKIKLKEESIGNSNITLGFIGNISKWQGLEDLIKAFQQVQMKFKNLNLLIIGDGNYRKELMKNLGKKNNILFTGSIPYCDMNSWINMIDIAFVPKVKELEGFTSPLKLRDYAACGCAVIGSDIIDLNQFTKYNWFDSYKNIKDLEYKIEYLINNSLQLNKMQKLARKFALDNFSWDLAAKKIIEY